MLRVPSSSFALLGRVGLACGAALFAGHGALAQSQGAGNQGTTTPARSETLEEIVVTGFRGSLLNATAAKENSVAFTDSIFAEDVGKFPDQNLAESLQRVPGVQLTRDPVTGSGQFIAVRALPPSFSQVTVGGNRINPQWSNGGATGFSGREIPLELFPSELFSRIDVSKTPSADQLEGGISGSVNLTNARPFDNPDTDYVAVSAALDYNDLSERESPRGSVLASHAFGDFGVLVGLSVARKRPRTDGWESIGWTTGRLPAGVCNAPCVDAGPNDATYATVVPPNAGNGLTPGATVNFSALNPGTSIQQLANGVLPRLARPAYFTEEYKHGTGLLALEWRPSDSLAFALDAMHSKGDRFDTQYDMNWIVRNSGPAANAGGGMVPINVSVDENNVITRGTFANSHFFIENRTFDQDMKYTSVSPSMSWQVTDQLHIDAQLSANDSDYEVIRPSINMRTLFPAVTTVHGDELAAGGGGLTVTYINDGSRDVPTIITSRNLADPSIGWTLERAQLAKVTRESKTRGAQASATWTLGDIDIKFGGSYDELWREIKAFDNETAWTANFRSRFPDPGTGIQQYLHPLNVSGFFDTLGGNSGMRNFVVADMEGLKRATNFYELARTAPQAGPANQAVTQGLIEEEYTAGYGMVSGNVDVFERELRFNVGGRYARTKQDTAGPVLLNGNLLKLTRERDYDDFLPSANVVYKIRDNINLRVAASKTITRPIPDDLLPGFSIIDPSVQQVNSKNHELEPFTSTNFDIGGEYYTGDFGYVGLALFRKDMKNFISTVQERRPFSSLGIPLSALTPIQQASVANSGGPDQHIVTVNIPTNSSNPLKFDGAEVTWVQPLDFALQGLGFSTVYTYIETSGRQDLVSGVPENAFNFTGFFERGPFSIHASYAWSDDRITTVAPAGGHPGAGPIQLESRGQLDLSASYELGFFEGTKLFFNVVNVTNEPLKVTWGYDSATENVWSSGTHYSLGVQAKF